jgi:hypothetical protein
VHAFVDAGGFEATDPPAARTSGANSAAGPDTGPAHKYASILIRPLSANQPAWPALSRSLNPTSALSSHWIETLGTLSAATTQGIAAGGAQATR